MIVEGFVFGYLTRAPMRPEKPEELNFELAESLTPIDAYTMEVKLRKGVKFHNGAPFTSADVKATYEYGCLPDRPAQWYPGRVKIDIVDDYTCRINTKDYGYPATLYYYLSSFLPIMSAKDIANKAQLSARMNGTGPFKYVKQDGDTTILAANPDFFMGSPKVPESSTTSSATRPPARCRCSTARLTSSSGSRPNKSRPSRKTRASKSTRRSRSRTSICSSAVRRSRSTTHASVWRPATRSTASR